MAHGISGPLALLALAMRRGIAVDGHAAAIDRICQWLDAWRHEAPAGPWWPERVTLAELRTGRSIQDGPARPSWCYGTPGRPRAQQLAGLALGSSSPQGRGPTQPIITAYPVGTPTDTLSPGTHIGRPDTSLTVSW